MIREYVSSLKLVQLLIYLLCMHVFPYISRDSSAESEYGYVYDVYYSQAEGGHADFKVGKKYSYLIRRAFVKTVQRLIFVPLYYQYNFHTISVYQLGF